LLSIFVGLGASVVEAAPCPSNVVPLQGGWFPPNFCASVWSSGLGSPRGMVTAQNGDILVVEAARNRILALWDDDDDGVNDPHETAVIATASGINHGIQIHDQYLYASNPTTLFRWRYQAGQRTNLGNPQIVISNVPCCHHVTRTPVFDENGLLYLQVGSNSNVDPDSTHARIHRFNISSGSFPIDWSQGFLFADGLRNEVGLGFDQAGRLWGVENGCDQLVRNDLGGDIHNDNPAEEVNLFAQEGKFYGYPYCWSEFLLPQGVGGGAGTQWLHPQFSGDGVHTDAWCKSTSNVVRPVWNLAAHQAPLDIMFYNGKSFPRSFVGDAFVTLHGSWNRNPPQGYRIVHLTIRNGLPVSEDVLLRYDGASQNWPSNLRPVAMSLADCKDGNQDTRDCLFMTSDASGQIIKIGYLP